MTNPTITGRPGADAPETPDPLSPSRPADADRKPKWLDRRAQSKYLEDEHGLRVSPRRLTNLAWEGNGPEERFFGRTPLSAPQWLDAWVQSRIKAKSRRRISHQGHTSGDNDPDASTPESAADRRPRRC